MRNVFMNELLELAKKDKDIELITGDLGFGVLKPFWEQVPDQFINAGIAEQNMTSVAAGMAKEGKIVFTYSIANFPTLRCLEQIRNDCAYPEMNVKVLCIGGGLTYGSLGMSHQSTEDVAILRALPNVTVVCPGDPAEAKILAREVAYCPGTVFVRLGRAGGPRVHKTSLGFKIGELVPVGDIAESGEIAILSTGEILDEATKVSESLRSNGIAVSQYSVPTVKPLDEKALRQIAHRFNRIVTIEEHTITGGLGGAVAESLSALPTHAPLLRIGINDEYCSKVGDRAFLRKVYGLDAASILEQIEDKVL